MSHKQKTQKHNYREKEKDPERQVITEKKPQKPGNHKEQGKNPETHAITEKKTQKQWQSQKKDPETQ